MAENTTENTENTEGADGRVLVKSMEDVMSE